MCFVEEGLGHFQSATQKKILFLLPLTGIRQIDKVLITERNRKEIKENTKYWRRGRRGGSYQRSLFVAWEYYAKNHFYHYEMLLA